MRKINASPHEDAEQGALFYWARMMEGKYPQLRLLFHIPNGGSRHKAEAARLQAQGVKAGVPDLFLPCAAGGYHGLFIEMKRCEGGRLSDRQREWLAALEEEGYAAAVCFGWEDAKNTIMDYLEGKA